jgi:hypothetical protein
VNWSSFAFSLSNPNFVTAAKTLMMLSILGLLMYLRTGSLFVVMEKMWRLIAGKSTVTNKKLKDYLQERRDIETFNFMHGLRARSVEKVGEYIDWSKSHDISLTAVKWAGGWFDHTKLTLKKTPNGRHLGVGLFANVIVFLSIVACLSIYERNEVLLQMKVSEVQFWLEPDGIRSFGSTDWRLTSKDCRPLPTSEWSVTKMTPAESRELCEALSKPTFSAMFDNELHKQRSAIVIIAVWLGTLLSMAILYFVGMLAALDICNRLAADKKPDA